MKKIGRPSSYTDEVADAICERIADGQSLRSICEIEGMPNKATVFRWLTVNEAFRDQYARARETQADTIFDEILDIADDGHNDWMLRKFGDDERWVENGEALRRSACGLMRASGWQGSCARRNMRTVSSTSTPAPMAARSAPRRRSI